MNRPPEPSQADSVDLDSIDFIAERDGAAPPAVGSPTEQPSAAACPVVGIVASAGGLTAFTRFFHALPTPNGIAFVIVPHLDATHKSLMAELLGRQTSMPVVEATDGVPVAGDHVYVIPPNRVLTIEGGKLRLADFPVPIETQTAIDAFLRALAVDQGERAVGIVLSGTGSYGTLGIREIKSCGGMAMAQAPDSAEFGQMPQSAIETGLVDFVLPPEQMPKILLQYVHQPYVQAPQGLNSPTADVTADLAAILVLIREQTRYDFSYYRKNMLLRRIARRMSLLHLSDMKEYCRVLASQPGEVRSLCKDCLIGVTTFFRDPEAFAVLEQIIIPALSLNHTLETPIRVWVPSCATGEEAYSISILLFEALMAADQPLNFQVFASDINPDSINFARRGIYPGSIASDVSPSRLKRFFEPHDDLHFRVKKQLRDSIVFSHHNLIFDAPFSKMDLISCRNALIYLDPEVQQKIITMFHFALKEDRYLMLGPTETVGQDEHLFTTVSKAWRIYRRLGRRRPMALPLFESRGAHPASLGIPVLPVKKSYNEIAESIIISNYAPATALINRNHEILNVTGPLVNYLEFPAGEVTKNLLALARSGLRTRLRAACNKALQEGREVTESAARVKRDGVYFPCVFDVRPVPEENHPEGLLLVLFRELNPASIDKHAAPPVPVGGLNALADERLVELLEYELKTTREELQSTTEQLRCGIEELQSSNEELESSKEELQSLNEELSTVNCQLLEKVAELDLSNSEILNLMSSSEIATLILDRDLRVRRFSQPAGNLLHVDSGDTGKLVGQLQSPLIDRDMLTECERVLSHEVPVESEVTTTQGKCLLRRLLPYRGTNQQTEGVVVTFIDLTERKRCENRQHEQEMRFRKVFDNVATGIAITNWEGVFEDCNPAYCDLLGYSQAELRKIQYLSLVHPEDQQATRERIEDLRLRSQASFEIENRYLRSDGQIVWVRKFVSPLTDALGNPTHLVALVTNMTATRKAVMDLQESEAKTLAILSSLRSHIAVIDHGGTIRATNPAWDRFMQQHSGTPDASSVGKNYFELGQCPLANPESREVARTIAQGLRAVLDNQKRDFSIEFSCRAGGERYWFLLQANPLKDGQGGAVISYHDITRRKFAEERIREHAERLRAILDTASDAIVTIDDSGRIESVNQQTAAMFGYSCSELIGMHASLLMALSFGDHHSGDNAPSFASEMALSSGSGREVICRRKDGSIFPADLAFSQVDHLKLYTAILRDISSRKEMQKHILETAADEQRRIGLELHDSTQQELTGLTLFANALVETIDSVTPLATDGERGPALTYQLNAATYERLRSTSTLLVKRLSAANQHVRDLSHGIMPVQIDAEGLRSALQELVDSTNCEKVRAHFHSSGSFKSLGNTTATHLYRIAQEAISNAIRHGAATQIAISLTEKGQQISLQIADNGVGFDPATSAQSASATHRMGMRTMEYRASLMGGAIQVSCGPEGGTVVRCLISNEVPVDGKHFVPDKNINRRRPPSGT